MNIPLVLCTYFVEGLLLYDVFIDVSQLFHPQYHKYLPFFYDCLICSCCTFSHFFYFPNLVKTDLFYILLQNYMRRDEFVLIKGISNRVFLNLHPVVVTVVITLSLSFLLPQHKVRLKKNTLSRGSPYILFQPSHLHFY